MPPEDSTEMEGRARRMGWVDQDEFRGKSDNWVPAERFVALAEESLPHLKGTLKTMERKMEDQERILREQNTTIGSLKDDITEFVHFSKGAEERAYNKAVKDLQASQREAKESGDMPAFVKATEDLDAVIADHPALTGKAKATTPAASPPSMEDEYRVWMAAEPTAFDDWKKENDWFEKEPDMFAYSQQMDQFLQLRNGFKMPRSKRLLELTNLVKKKFPEYFGNPAQKKGSPVEGDSGGGPSGNGKQTYNDLPPDAKKQCDKWTGQDGKGSGTMGESFTRADYIKSYRW